MLETCAPAQTLASSIDATLPGPHSLVLHADSFKHFIDEFNSNDDERYQGLFPNSVAWDFLKGNTPLLDCPDDDIEKTYYFRWWTYRKHIKQSPDGFIITEF